MNNNEAIKLEALISQLNQLLPAAHTAAGAHANADLQALRTFVRGRLRAHSKGAVAIKYLWQAYTEHSGVTLPRNRFLRLLPAPMFAEFSVRKSHRVATESGAARGFCGVCFKPDVAKTDAGNDF